MENLPDDVQEKLLREFLSAALKGDLAGLAEVIERRAFLSREHCFLCSFLFLLEIDTDAGTVRLGPKLKR